MDVKPKVAFAVPFYSVVDGVWWVQTTDFIVNTIPTIEYHGLIAMGTMATDHARNTIVDDFLYKSNAEWLFWIDADTLVPVGTLSRLLALGKTLVSGLYYGKNPPHPPIAYYKLPNGTYIPIDKQEGWEKGEILPVDATGFGCMLTHRSVFEDIRKNYEIFQYANGGIASVHKNDVVGEFGTTADGYHRHEHDGKVYKGQYRERLINPTIDGVKFPFFMLEHLRTEDMYFFDHAARVGHKPWLDTSIECGHLRPVPYQGKDYRDEFGH
jgi:hypothetical protein